ncbi:MAG TPA: sigma-54 dependent transcriptional regulator, partial [Gammaproteobacteria bacterium]
TQDLGMQRLLETARQIAGTDTSVVIHGESGTGKELLARFIHQNSLRSKGPFVAFNCGALHEEIAASELFGHEKGAFTGANATKIGLFEAAEGGTLFLDEVAEMPLLMQVKLLRVLQERELMRVGSVHPIPVDVRVIAASNRDLKAAVADGQMRNDLYFRLNVMTLTLPPLRERRDDIPLLAYYLLRKFSAMMDRDVQEISTEGMRRLVEYDYPGNVRELSNFIERGVALAQGRTLDIEHLPQSLGALTVRVFKPEMAATPTTLEEQETEHILAVLKMADGNRTQAAKMLGIDRVSLWRKLKKLGIDTK